MSAQLQSCKDITQVSVQLQLCKDITHVGVQLQLCNNITHVSVQLQLCNNITCEHPTCKWDVKWEREAWRNPSNTLRVVSRRGAHLSEKSFLLNKPVHSLLSQYPKKSFTEAFQKQQILLQ